MKKGSLLEKINVSHRQLLRHVFFFENDAEGNSLASDRPRFGLDEMLQPGVVGDWSLKDLLADLLYWERNLIRWIGTAPDDDLPADVPPFITLWDDLHIDELKNPELAESCSLQEILAKTRTHYRDVITAVDGIPEDKLFVNGAYRWTGQKSAADYVALCTSDHYDWAKKLVRNWRRTHAGEYLNKEVILERIRVERQRLEKNFETLTRDERQQPGVVGEWSVKDLLAHLADWEQRFIGWYQAGLRGELPDVPARGITWAELDKLNRQIFEVHRDRSLDDVMNWYNHSFSQLLEVVKGIPEEDIFTPGLYPWLGRSSLMNYILANSANHYRWAKALIRKWRTAQTTKD